MSNHYNLVQRPPVCVAAHSPNTIQFSPPQGTLLLAVNSNGNVLLILSGSYSIGTPQDEQWLFITQGIYKGYHRIKQTILGHVFLLHTPFTQAVNTPMPVYYMVAPLVQLYTGWQAGEVVLPDGSDFYQRQPHQLLAEFKPEANLNGLYTFNLEGYLKSSMATPYVFIHNLTETDPTYATPLLNILFDGYARLQVVCNGNLECTLYVFNASVSTAQLNRYFVNTGRALGPLPFSPQFTHGLQWADYINNQLLLRIKP